MSKSHDVFLYVGTYESENDAEVDLMTVKDLHSDGVIGTYDAAVVSKTGTRFTYTRSRSRPSTAHGPESASARSWGSSFLRR